jgi:MazG family protein
MKKAPAINDLLRIMARLRAPDGCPWDRQQTHASLRFHAVEEVYEMIDAIEAGDDTELEEELGDLLLQVVFHCQLARERGAFDFERVARRIADKLIHRHPHVFGDARARTVAAVWEQWDRLKRAEKHGTRHQRDSALDGIPRHLPALLRAQKLVKKATKVGLAKPQVLTRLTSQRKPCRGAATQRQVAAALFALARFCQEKGWSAEELLRQETGRCEKTWRREERKSAKIVK